MNFDNDVEGKPKISVNIEEIRYNDRNLYQNVNMNNNRMKRPYSGYEENYRNKGRKNNSFSKKSGNNFYNNNNFQQNNTQDNNYYDDEDDDGEIKMVYNTGNNANVIETKINKENNFSKNNIDITNNAAFNEFEKTIQKLQEHLQQKNSNNENNYNSQKNEIILNKEISMKNKNCNFVNNNNNSNIIKKNEINLNKKQSKKRRRKIIR